MPALTNVPRSYVLSNGAATPQALAGDLADRA